ncbi:hypothetical protein K7787_28505 [Streptomyces sp. RCPT1-4]|nr:BTAD domain-containing putative transcriptional regulator [Streptomyces sennicomposti]MBY8869656.1 hypothetical protein [Streptomyces sennicomposti]
MSASHPLDESLLALRMRALYGSERQAEVLAACTDMRRLLRQELGVDPGQELRRVHEAVLPARRRVPPWPRTGPPGRPARPRAARGERPAWRRWPAPRTRT